MGNIQNIGNNKEYLSNYLVAESVLNTVIDQLNIPSDEIFHRANVLNLLKNQLTAHLVRLILKSLSKNQTAQLQIFLMQNPKTGFDESIIAFANSLPEIEKVIHQSLKDFFEKFINNYKSFRNL